VTWSYALLAMVAKPDPFQFIRRSLADLPGPSAEHVLAVRARQASLTKPAGSLGRLEEIVEFLAAWQAKPWPTIERPVVLVCVGSHGVAAHGVSAYPASVTRAMVANFAAGGAAINQICATFGVRLEVLCPGQDEPTADITEAPAMDAATATASFTSGMDAVPDGTDLLCLGEMGIGNTTIAAAVYHGLYGGRAIDWVGRGTGVDAAGLARKIAAVETAVWRHAAQLADPLALLACLGGTELAALAGAIVSARLKRIPVLLDGYVVCAAAAILQALDSAALDHCLAAHRSAEAAHEAVLRRLGKAPLLDLGLRLGEGSGAALAVGLVQAAVACHAGMATFAEARVEGAHDEATHG
jgi:nicotinate-nucleotide--dimethylbenzimidazole phosphoribosyltransferase